MLEQEDNSKVDFMQTLRLLLLKFDYFHMTSDT